MAATCKKVAATQSTYALSGALDFNTVPALLAQMKAEHDPLQGSGDIYVDLAGVERSNSAGLGLLIEWVIQARQQQRTIYFSNLPNALLQIARISELELPVKPV